MTVSAARHPALGKCSVLWAEVEGGRVRIVLVKKRKSRTAPFPRRPCHQGSSAWPGLRPTPESDSGGERVMVRSRAREKPFRWQSRGGICTVGQNRQGPWAVGRWSPGVPATALASFRPVCGLPSSSVSLDGDSRLTIHQPRATSRNQERQCPSKDAGTCGGGS